MQVSAWLVVPAAFLIGSRQHAFGILGHEGGHRLIAKNRWLNDLLGVACFMPLLLSFPQYRGFHLAHHSHLGTELDPEVQLRKVMPGYTYPNARILTDLLGAAVYDAYYFSRYLRPEPGVLLAHAAAFIALASLGLWWVYAVWALCLVTTHWFFFRVRAWGEHRGTTTLTFRWHWLVRWLVTPHNIWLHWEHHADPTIPFYRLQPRPNAKTMALRQLLRQPDSVTAWRSVT